MTKPRNWCRHCKATEPDELRLFITQYGWVIFCLRCIESLRIGATSYPVLGHVEGAAAAQNRKQ